MKNLIDKLFDKKHKERTVTYLIVIVLFIVCQILLSTGNMSSLMTSLLVPTCCYIVAAISLNLVVGISGELSLGHASFMAVGAFTAVCVSGFLEPTISSGIIRLIISMIAGTILSAIFGFIIGIPVLKLKGDYLAIVTLAFCQIVKSLINNMYLGFDANGIQFSFVDNKLNLAEGGKALLSGPMGATGTTRISTFLAGAILIIITLVVVFNLMYSKSGRAIMAARDNRIAAQSVGVDVTKTKMLAFVISAALAGAAGALYGLNFSTLTPAKFDFNQSIAILVYVVLGGLGNIKGTVIATTILYILPELLRGLSDYRMLIYAIILIVIMIVSNNEIVKEKRDKLLNKFKKKEVK